MILLGRAGVRFAGADFDTMVASYVLDPGRRQHSVGFVSADVLRRAVAPLDELTGRGRKRIPTGQVAPEAASDALCGGRKSHSSSLPASGPNSTNGERERLFRCLEMPLVPLLSGDGGGGDPHRSRRLRLDEPATPGRARTRPGGDLQGGGGELQHQLEPQLRRVLFETMELPVVKRTKTGPSTDASVLEELAARGYSLPPHLLDYRRLEKLRSTYVDALPNSSILHGADPRLLQPGSRGNGATLLVEPETSRTSRSAPISDARYGEGSSPRRGTCSSRPTTRRSNSGSWPTSPVIRHS